jgi:hypothetical protein
LPDGLPGIAVGLFLDQLRTAVQKLATEVA